MIETACNAFVLVLRDEFEETDLYIPDAGRKKPHTGIVQAVGPLTEDENIKAGKGMVCLFHPTVGFMISYQGQDYWVLTDREIIALP